MHQTLFWSWFKFSGAAGNGSQGLITAELLDLSASTVGKLTQHYSEKGSVLELGFTAWLLSWMTSDNSPTRLWASISSMAGQAYLDFIEFLRVLD